MDVLEPDVYSETLLLDDLRPTTDYQFVAVVGSSVGTADPILANASTPLGKPNIQICVYRMIHSMKIVSWCGNCGGSV